VPREQGLALAGEHRCGRTEVTLPLHDEAMVSPISAVPWAVTLWRDLPEEVLRRAKNRAGCPSVSRRRPCVKRASPASAATGAARRGAGDERPTACRVPREQGLALAGEHRCGRTEVTLPLHDEAMVSPISAVPWAVTLWRDLPEEVLLAATEHLHSCVVHAGVSKEGHVAWFATWGEGEQAAAFDAEHCALKPLFDELRAQGLEIHVISGVGYPTPVFTLAEVEALATDLSCVVEPPASL
jgi:hypothetical protein